jgi:uncharacterized protein (DUF697 family)
MWWSVAAGFIPIPLVDVGALTGVQIKMLSEISKCYNVAFSENRAKSIISALLASIVADSMNKSIVTSFVKSIPLVGFVAGFSMPIYSAASTYAIGHLFIQHFETGGVLFDFDPSKIKSHFANLYEKGKEMASNLTAKPAKA